MWTCPNCEIDLAESDKTCACGFTFSSARTGVLSIIPPAPLASEEEPPSKKAKKALNYGAKQTPDARVKEFPGDFVVRNELLWCLACQKPVQHERKSVVEAHTLTTKHTELKGKLAQKLVSSPSGSCAESPVSAKGPLTQGDVKKMMQAKEATFDARDDLAAAFIAAGIPLSKLEHPSIRGFLRKHTKDSGCYPKDDRTWQQCVPRVTNRHLAAVRDKVADKEADEAKRERKKLVISFDEWTDSRGCAMFHVLCHTEGKTYMLDAVRLECKGPNDGVEHTEVAEVVSGVLIDAGLSQKQVTAFVFDEGSVMVAAYEHVLQRMYPKAVKHVCVAHKLHSTGKAMTSSGFENLDLLFSSVSLVKSDKHASRRRRWFAHLRNAGKQACVPPKVGETRWCSWRDAADWWRVHIEEWKKFVLLEAARSPWNGVA